MSFSRLVLTLSLLTLHTASFALPPRRMSDPQFRAPVEMKVVQDNYSQLIDHFTPSTAKFSQRYFYSSSYAKSPDAPVFFIICGEGECGGIDIPSTIRLAQKVNANLVALEHRFYGSSQPFPGDQALSNEHLKYLTMAQAIEDLATFQKEFSSKMAWTGKWISVGGSYPGALSAFYRSIHPELVVGALASSGTVHAEADFYEYDQHVGQALGAKCLSAVRKVIADVESKIQTPESKLAIKKTFESLDINDDQDFLYVVGDMLGAVVQYGAKDKFCTALVDGDAKGRATEAYAEAGIDVYRRLGYLQPSDGAFGSYLDTTVNNPHLASMRGWMFQSCNEFGFYQTVSHDPNWAARSSQITLQYHNEACKRMFGLDLPVDDQATNRKFFDPLLTRSTSNILFTNGSVDPFSEASITPENPHGPLNPALTLFMIPGGSHCIDLYDSLLPSIVKAQDTFAALVADWIK